LSYSLAPEFRTEEQYYGANGIAESLLCADLAVQVMCGEGQLDSGWVAGVKFLSCCFGSAYGNYREGLKRVSAPIFRNVGEGYFNKDVRDENSNLLLIR
jgi:hypothetical protein